MYSVYLYSSSVRNMINKVFTQLILFDKSVGLVHAQHGYERV